jgi:hypothetical protein
MTAKEALDAANAAEPDEQVRVRLVTCALKDAAEVESRGFGERVFVEFPNRLS